MTQAVKTVKKIYYSTNTVQDLLGLSKTQLYYCRNQMDLISTHRKFSPESIFVYRIIKHLHFGHRLQFCQIKEYGSDELFKYFEAHFNPNEISKLYLLVNNKLGKFEMINLDEYCKRLKDGDSPDMIIHLKKILAEHFKSFHPR